MIVAFSRNLESAVVKGGKAEIADADWSWAQGSSMISECPEPELVAKCCGPSCNSEGHALRGDRGIRFCIQHASEKQIPRFARNDNFAFSANLRLRTLVAYRKVLIQSSQFGEAFPHIAIDTLRGIYLQ